MYRSLDDMDLEGKRVLVRLGTDVPLDKEGRITDDRRIVASLPTIRYILDRSPKQLILMCHIGRPKEKERNLRTDVVAEYLSHALSREVFKVDGWEAPRDKDIVFLENLRFNQAEKNKSEEERDFFGKSLADQCDLFVQDAFSNCHRDHASMTSVTKFVPSCVGRVVEDELAVIGEAMENPKRPFVSVIGGLKADKLNAVKNILCKADKVLIAGALAFTVLKSMGYDMGSSKIDDEGISELKDIVEEIRGDERVILPVDAVVADGFSADADSKIVPIDSVPEGWMALDIGPKTLSAYKVHIAGAKTIVWNGPIGVFEFRKFSNGTRQIAESIVDSGAKTIVGGGDSADAIDKMGLADKISHVSSGGGASLTLFEGKKLIAVEALKENYKKFRK